jgi:hypothetical protein
VSLNWLGRIDRIALVEGDNHDNIVVRDVNGFQFQMAPPGARALHRELGKFLSMENDGKPLPNPTRADFRSLQLRVEALEKQARLSALPKETP